MRRGRCRESGRATARARQRRACCEGVAEGEPPKGGERGASGGGAQRRRAVRLGKVSGRAAGDGSGATEPRQRLCTGSAARTRKRSAQRALASVGDRDRHRNGEDRVSGLRGAGWGEAAPGGIEPGARSADRAGALTYLLDELTISSRGRKGSERSDRLKGSGGPRTAPR